MNLANAVESWRSLQAATGYAREDLIKVVRAAHAEGYSESELARLVGVQRQTIRTWLGK